MFYSNTEILITREEIVSEDESPTANKKLEMILYQVFPVLEELLVLCLKLQIEPGLKQELPRPLKETPIQVQGNE